MLGIINEPENSLLAKAKVPIVLNESERVIVPEKWHDWKAVTTIAGTVKGISADSHDIIGDDRVFTTQKQRLVIPFDDGVVFRIEKRMAFINGNAFQGRVVGKDRWVNGGHGNWKMQ